MQNQNLIPKENYAVAKLEEIKEDLARSRLILTEIRLKFTQVSGKNIAHEVEPECQQLVAQYPDRPEGKIRLARVAEANEDWNTALTYWDQCLTLFPQQDPLPCLEAKARVLIQLGREKEAEELFKPIIEKFLKDKQINL